MDLRQFFVNSIMPKNKDHLFKPYSQDQLSLLPPSLESLIPLQHPVRAVNSVIDQLDLNPILQSYSGGGAELSPPDDAQGVGLCLSAQHFFLAQD